MSGTDPGNGSGNSSADVPGDGPSVDPATGREPEDPRHSNDELAGEMGVSSEREGHAGPGQHGTDGVRDTSLSDAPPDAPPEQSAGGEEANPEDPRPPKSGFPSRHPRADEKPFRPTQ